jgi:hypothetical protein
MKIRLLFGLTFLLSLILVGQTQAGNLIAYYPFNGDANDASGHGLNGSVSGATLTADRNGDENSAYSFNGLDNYIVVNDDPTLNPSSGIVVEAWIYPTAYPSGDVNNANKQILMKESEYSLVMYPDGKASFGIGPFPWVHAYSLAAVPLNQWSHLRGTFDRQTGTISFYVNSILQDSANRIVGGWQNNGPLYIGKNPSAHETGYIFSGKIDEVRISEGNSCNDLLVDDFTGTQLDVSKWEVHSDAQSCGATVTQNDSLVLTFPDNANNCGHLNVVSIRDFSSYADNISFEVDVRTTTLRNWQDQPLYFCSPYGAIGYQNDGNKWYVVYVQSDGQYKTEYVLTEVISDMSYRLRIEVANGVLTFSRSVDGGSMSSLLSVAAGQFLSNAYQVAPQAFLYPGRVVLASSDRGDTYFDNLVVTSCPGNLRVADMAVVSPDSLPPAPNMPVTITVGNSGVGRDVSDIDPATIRINGTLSPTSLGVQTGHLGFTGSVLGCVTKVRDLRTTYADRSAPGLQLVISGAYRDGISFTVQAPIRFYEIWVGDVNGDGFVDGKDVTALASYLKNGKPVPVSIGNADVNQDGNIDLSDLSALVKLVGGTRAESNAF